MMKKVYKLLLLTLLVAALCVVMASCGEPDPGPSNVCAHTYDNGTITTPATCIAKGTRTYTCTKCGDSYTQDDVSKIDHSYAEVGEVTTAPTCTTTGIITYTCTTEGCTATDTNILVMIEHEASDTMASDATWHWYPCKMCGFKMNSAGHVFDETKTTVKEAATCLKEGADTKTCKDCGAKVDFPTAKTDHKWDAGKVTSAASTTNCKSGRSTLTCTETGCGATKTVATAGATQHTIAYEAVTVNGTKQLKFTCSVCEDSWTSAFAVNADGTNVMQNDITWNIKAGYASTPTPALKDGAYEILLGANASAEGAQAEFFFPAKGKVADVSAANSTRIFYTISLKAPTAGLFTNGFSVKLTNEEGLPRWTPVHAVNIFEVKSDGTIVGNTDAEGRTIQLGTVTSTDWTNIYVAIELDGTKIYFTYIVNGDIRGTAVLANTLKDMKANDTYFTGSTNTPNTGILIDNMTWSQSNDTASFLPANRHLEHTWVAGTVTPPSTTTCAVGYTEYTCSGCGNTKHDDFVPSSIAHTWDEFNVVYEKEPVAADTANGVEAEDGKWTLTCTKCGWTETVTGSFADHVHGFNANAGVENDEKTETTYDCIVDGCDETKIVEKEAAAGGN